MPYTFLMNTAHNKDLITDDGWSNTILNTLPAMCKPNSYQIADVEEEQPSTSKASNKTKQRAKVNDADQKSTLKTISGDISANYQRSSRQNVQADIHVMSKSSEHDYITLPNIPQEQPSTSKGITVIEQRQRVYFSQRSTSETDNDSICLQQSYRLYIGEKILSNMKSNINNEERYLHYFRQLIKFEETLTQEDPCPQGFKIVHITEFHTPKKRRIKRSNAQPKDNELLYREKLIALSKSKNASPQNIAIQTNMVGRFSDRVDMRAKILQNWQVYCSDEETYDNFIDRMLKFEESLIRN